MCQMTSIYHQDHSISGCWTTCLGNMLSARSLDLSAVIGHLSLLLGENAVQCAVVCQQSEGRHTMQHCIQFQSVLYSLMADDSI